LENVHEGLNTAAIDDLGLVGGSCCLDFTNTVNWRASDNPNDRIQTYGDLVHWAMHADLITPSEARELSALAAQKPANASRALRSAIDLREIVFSIFWAIASGTGPSGEDLVLFNRHLARAMSKSAIMRENGRYVIGFTHSQELDRMLAPIAWSAAELLMDPRSSKVKECSGETCGWLFVDTSKNHSRRWCEMRDCGNRAKAKRHYQKVRSTVRKRSPSSSGRGA
jgi:predicted RNA-binding Zn ribbon-like protein